MKTNTEAIDRIIAGDQAKRLGPILERLDQAERDLYAWVDDARAVGRTWADIGADLGVSRQAAQQRFGDGA